MLYPTQQHAAQRVTTVYRNASAASYTTATCCHRGLLTRHIPALNYPRNQLRQWRSETVCRTGRAMTLCVHVHKAKFRHGSIPNHSLSPHSRCRLFCTAARRSLCLAGTTDARAEEFAARPQRSEKSSEPPLMKATRDKPLRKWWQPHEASSRAAGFASTRPR